MRACILTSVVAVTALCGPLTAQTSNRVRASDVPDVYEILPFHSQVEFAVPFMGLATVKGAFEDFTGTLLLDERALEKSSVAMVIQAASLHTGNALRDKHLRSDDFFDVEKYPALVFESDHIERAPGGAYRVHGTLTMHGTSRAIVLPFSVRHAVRRDVNGVDYAGFDATVRLDWRDYGIQGTNKNNSWFQPATMLVNDSVTVTLAIQATRRHPSKLSYPALNQGMASLSSGGVSALSARYAAVKALGADSLERFARPLADMGNALVEQGRATDGVAVLKLNVDAHPTDATARSLLAYGYLASGDRAAAVAAYREAIGIDALEPQALAMLRRLSHP